MVEITKEQLRKDYLAKRSALEPVARQRDSAIIRQRLFRLTEWEDAGTVLCYISMSTEVDTRKCIEEALGRRKRVIVPVLGASAQDGFLSELRSLDELAPARIKGLMEQAPKFHRRAEPEEVEVALIPGVVFDRQGGRIGFGGGYFDRVLARMSNAVRIGLAFSIQVHPSLLPLKEHDVPLHKIITEAGILIPKVTV